MVKRKRSSKMSAKARMAYVRSFIGKKKGRRGGSLKEQMDYVRSFRGKKSKSGGKFPKGTLSQWRAKANSGSAAERAKYKRAIANWNKLMGKAGFKEKWNANKKVKGGALEDGVNYRDLISMYQNRNFGGAGIKSTFKKVKNGFNTLKNVFKQRDPWDHPFLAKGGAIRAAGLPPAFLGVKGRKYYKRGGAIPVASGGTLNTGFTPSMAKKFESIYKKHVKQGAGITKRDLYRGAGKQNSLFYTRNRMLKRQRKKPMTISPPNDEMVQLYRNLYKHSGIHPENMIDPIVRNDRLKGGNVFKKIGRAAAKTGKFIKKHKIASTVANFIPGPVGVAARLGAKALGAGLIEEAGLNGRGHPDYIYH